MSASSLCRGRMGERAVLKGLLLLVWVVLLTPMGGCPGPVPPGPQPSQMDIAGRWTGSFDKRQVDDKVVTEVVRVDLDVKNDDNGKLKAYLDFGPAWSCKAEAVFTRTDEGEHLFRLIAAKATGQRTEELGNGDVTLKREGEQLHMDVTSENGGIHFSALLDRVPG